MSNRFPHLILNDGKRFYFGQDLREAEEIFAINAKPYPPELARVRANHRIIETAELELTFDSGKLSNMEFREGFDFQIPLIPYCERWKNLDSIVFPKSPEKMMHEDAMGKLALWEKRAQQSGAKKIEAGDDLAINEFSTASEAGECWNMIGISLGQSRRTGGGGLWMDGWIFQFTSATDLQLHKIPVGIFQSVSAFCDEFNTAARNKTVGS